ncbi:hypothetical protein JTB14_014192 [Gonioctena quinquepunctata]|nr:hypothetical protein JTB14_014192 [Gonioctena quinquepunctata]
MASPTNPDDGIHRRLVLVWSVAAAGCVSLLNSLHSKSMHAIYRGTLCQGEQMYKINISAVCATTRAMIPESHKSGQRVGGLYCCWPAGDLNLRGVGKESALDSILR